MNDRISNLLARRCLRYIALGILSILVSGCGGEGTAKMIVNIGGTATPNTPGEAMWLNFKRDAEAAANGTLEMRPLIYGQLGSEEQLLSSIRRNRIQFANLSAQVTSTLVPELSLLYAPYLFADEDEADFIYDRYLTPIYTELLAEQGLHLVTWYEIGFHSVYSKEPIRKIDDMRGRRFRVSSSVNARLFAEALGADVIPLGYGEIVPSLQTGLVDAGENSISLYARTGIAAEAPYLLLTRHVFGMSVIVANKSWWDGLSEDTRRVLTDNFPSVERSRAETRAQDVKDLADVKLGIQSTPLTAEERKLWEDRTSDVVDELLQLVGGRGAEIHAQILTGKQAYAQTENGN